MNEAETLNAICFWLIKVCRETNANEMKVTQKKVNFLGKDLGDWEIIVRKKKEPK